MVYSILSESNQTLSQQEFKKTELYQKCLETGIIQNPSKESAVRSHIKLKAPNKEKKAVPKGTQNTLTWSFSIENMWCPACAWVIVAMLKETNGVVDASCNFSSDRGRITYDPIVASPSVFKEIIDSLGYRVTSLENPTKQNKIELVRLAVTLVLTMNIMMFSWSLYSGYFLQLSQNATLMLSWLVLLMATIVLFYGGHPIHSRAYQGIIAKSPGMESLISIGSITAYCFSVLQVFDSSVHLYFDTSAMLLLLVLIGKRLEQSAKDKIVIGLNEFFSLAPTKVKRCDDHFPRGRYISVSQLSTGDVIQAEKGEIIAADGVTIEGNATVDESSLTGEAKPINATAGIHLKSGSRIIDGQVKIKALKIGKDSNLGKMMTIMENTLAERSPLNERFEGLLKIFIPLVIATSALTYLYGVLTGLSSYSALNRGLSVLVISCPCALGIAIPLALTAGTSLAGKIGILVKDLQAFQATKGVNCIVFDKTGTLTTGTMELMDIHTFNALTRKEALQIACSMESNSSHYIADAIKAHGVEQGVTPFEVTDMKHYSNGIRGEIQGQTMALGSRDFVRYSDYVLTHKSHCSDDVQLISEVFLTINDQLEATFQLGDSIRDNINKFIKTLKELGYDIYLISGDSNEATVSVGQRIGIDSHSCQGNLLPHQKASFITKLKNKGNKVIMIGDGVNDGPAMVESDLAVAVRSGLDPGEGASTITFLQENPKQLVAFLSLAQKVNTVVKQNLAAAIIYNLLAIPIAASGLLNPIVAVTAMSLSSLSVILNTLFMLKSESNRLHLKKYQLG
jgi:heavy metal translocating P-type ATPase